MKQLFFFEEFKFLCDEIFCLDREIKTFKMQAIFQSILIS